ncbi:hypothetical protein EGR_10928 [Echinococcus granulosus]|uniref:Uncharacterized protein n=1 Tax=Echinococcus granulosus TaxID=6210 RepID=W6TZG6_ECHGR|nr:hypothetical protein EGR_10928 [Echinococcus granulosus]EUB54210.1 hypothetical protein EGR_10928 [Echinococcus granulosus]
MLQVPSSSPPPPPPPHNCLHLWNSIVTPPPSSSSLHLPSINCFYSLFLWFTDSFFLLICNISIVGGDGVFVEVKHRFRIEGNWTTAAMLSLQSLHLRTQAPTEHVLWMVTRFALFLRLHLVENFFYLKGSTDSTEFRLSSSCLTDSYRLQCLKRMWWKTQEKASGTGNMEILPLSMCGGVKRLLC